MQRQRQSYCAGALAQMIGFAYMHDATTSLFSPPPGAELMAP
jgi:hypothetical protein